MRRAPKVDANQSAIVSALRRVGCEVLSLAAVGNGCPDLLVFVPVTDRLVMLECKDGMKAPSRRSLTPHQREFHKRWPVVVVEDENAALTAVGLVGISE